MYAASPVPPLLQDRFAATLLGVCEEAGVQGLRDRLMAPLLALLCRRLYGVMAQVSRTLTRFQAGRLPVRRKPGAGRARAMPALRKGGEGLRLRYGWAWMIRMAPRAAQYAPQVQVLLDEPEMQAALAASPSLRRALRPLCRGLAFPVPSVMMEAVRSRPGTRGRSKDVLAGTDAAAGTQGEAEASPPLPPAVTWPDAAPLRSDGQSVPASNRHRIPHHHPVSRHDPRPGARGSPGVAPAVLRLFTR